MSRHRKDPLRPLTPDERIALTRLSRSPSAPAAQVERARVLLAIADGASYTAAAHQVGRRHNETLSAWVSRFNRDGLAAVRPGHGVERGFAMALTRSSVFWRNGREPRSVSRMARPPGP
jgi:transposase-like protein